MSSAILISGALLRHGRYALDHRRRRQCQLPRAAPWSRVIEGFTGTHLQSLKTTPVTGFGSHDCAGYLRPACVGAPKWRHVFNVGWLTPWHGVGLNLRWRYFPELAFEPP